MIVTREDQGLKFYSQSVTSEIPFFLLFCFYDFLLFSDFNLKFKKDSCQGNFRIPVNSKLFKCKQDIGAYLQPRSFLIKNGKVYTGKCFLHFFRISYNLVLVIPI